MSAPDARRVYRIAVLVDGEEPYLRCALGRLLESRGFSILQHASADERVDVTVVDASAAAAFEADGRAAGAVVYLAAATEGTQTPASAGARATHVLRKPFTPDALERAIVAALGGAS